MLAQSPTGPRQPGNSTRSGCSPPSEPSEGSEPPGSGFGTETGALVRHTRHRDVVAFTVLGIFLGWCYRIALGPPHVLFAARVVLVLVSPGQLVWGGVFGPAVGSWRCRVQERRLARSGRDGCDAELCQEQPTSLPIVDCTWSHICLQLPALATAARFSVFTTTLVVPRPRINSSKEGPRLASPAAAHDWRTPRATRCGPDPPVHRFTVDLRWSIV